MAQEIVVDTGHEKKLFTVKESGGRLYIYKYGDLGDSQIGQASNMKDAIHLVQAYVESKGHKIRHVKIS